MQLVDSSTVREPQPKGVPATLILEHLCTTHPEGNEQSCVAGREKQLELSA